MTQLGIIMFRVVNYLSIFSYLNSKETKYETASNANYWVESLRSKNLTSTITSTKSDRGLKHQHPLWSITLTKTNRGL
jgi:hypothetical protein